MDVANTADVAWNGTAGNTTDVGTFYIVDTGYAAVGFLNSTTTVTNATTIGFSLFGGQVVYISDSNLEAQFWAQATGEDGVWSLMWNSDGTSQDGAVPVSLKTTAPAIVSATDDA